MSALVLAGALLTHCRRGAEDTAQQPPPAPAKPTPAASSPPTPSPPSLRPGAPEPLEVPALGELRGKRLEQLRVSANGALLFTRWEVAEETFDYRVVHLPTGKRVWGWKGVLPNDRWNLQLSPEGSAGIVFLALGPEAPYTLFRLSGAPTPLSNTEFPGGVWASGGGWFGGAFGAYNADGTPRGQKVPDWLDVEEELFIAGTRPDTLRYMHAGKVFEWDGRGTPTEVGSWRCSEQVKQHWMSHMEPPQISPDGRFIVWTVRDSGALTVCDGESGKELELAPGATPTGWADNRLLWRIDAGALVGMDVLTRENTPRITLPEGEKAVALAVATQPPALFVGTDKGRLLRIPLTR